MLTYYITYFSFLISTWVGSHSKNLQSFIYWSVLVFLVFFVGFRYEVGCDFPTYQNHYSAGIDIALARSSFSVDPGHWLLIAFLNYLGLHSQSLNFIASIIFFYGMHSIAKKQPNPLAFLVLCFPILIINMPMAATRQSIAIGFMCLSYCAFIDRRIFSYIFWIFIGASFHSSILIFLLLVPFIKNRLNIRSIFWSLFILIPTLGLIMLTESAEVATTRYIEGGSEAAGGIFRLGILTLGGAYFIIKLSKSWRRQFPEDYKIAKLGAWLMISFFVLIFLSSVVGDRYGYYLIPLQAMIFARIPYLNIGRFRILHSIFPYFLLSLTFVVWTLSSWHFSQCYVPYQFYMRLL